MTNSQTPFPGGSPAFGAIYGPSGLGKSTSAILAFPTAFFVGAQGAISHVARTVAGIDVASDVGSSSPGIDLESMKVAIEWAAGKGYKYIVADDMSLKADRTYRDLNSKSNGNGYYRFTRTVELLFQIRNFCREQAGIHCLMTGHEKTAWVDKAGIRHKGTIEFPGNEAPADFPPSLDFCYRAQIGVDAMPGLTMLSTMATLAPEPVNSMLVNPPAPPSPDSVKAASAALVAAIPPAPSFPGLPGLAGASSAFDGVDWPGIFRINESDPDWYSKDRFGTPDRCPMNIGEILRSSGFFIERAKGLEWTEDLIEQASVYMVGGAAGAGKQGDDNVHGWVNAQVIRVYAGKVDSEMIFKINRWVRRDVKARVWIRRAKLKQAAMLAPGNWQPPQAAAAR
jgi:hypothetical protein